MKIRLFAAIVAFLSLVPAISATAQEPVEMPPDLLEALGVTLDDVLAAEPNPAWDNLGLFSPDAQRVLEVAGQPADFITYAFGDDPNGTPVINPTGVTPTEFGTMLWQLPADWTPPAEGLTDTMAFAQTKLSQLAPGDNVVFMWAEMDSDYDFTSGLTISEGFPLTIPGDQVWNSTFPGDTWEGANLIPNAWYENGALNLDVYHYEGGASFPPVDLPTFYYRSGNVMAMAMSADALVERVEAAGQEAAAAESGSGTNQDLLFRGDSNDFFAQAGPYSPLVQVLQRVWAHMTTGAQFSPGFIFFRATALALLVTVVTILTTNLILFVPPPPTPPPSDEPDPTPDETDSAPADPAPAVVETQDEPEVEPVSDTTTTSTDSGGGISILLVFLLIGFILLIAGLWFAVFRPRRDQAASTTTTKTATTDKSTTYIVTGDGDDPRDTPPPTIYGEEIDSNECEWELWFLTDAGWVKLREAAQGKTVCCIYKVVVETKTMAHIQAASFRQDVQPERLYIPDLNFGWSGLDFSSNTSTRSGPFGRQDWMHGYGNPIDQSTLGDPEAYWQRGQGSEPVEVAAHLMHEELTRIKVTLESGCPGYENTYEGSGKGRVDAMSTHECTNDNPGPACPVELSAFGDSLGYAWGDLKMKFLEASGTDIDELERHAAALEHRDPDDPTQASPPPVPVIGRWDGHDHDVRDRVSYENWDSDSDSKTVEGDVWEAWILSSATLDAGQIVPRHVWPSTERVTTHIESAFKWDLKLHAEMIKEPCDPGPCVGHPDNVCHDQPEFELEISDNAREIRVDGDIFDLSRNPGTANRHSPPAAGNYVPWSVS